MNALPGEPYRTSTEPIGEGAPFNLALICCRPLPIQTGWFNSYFDCGWIEMVGAFVEIVEAADGRYTGGAWRASLLKLPGFSCKPACGCGVRYTGGAGRVSNWKEPAGFICTPGR
jgi:hypothetical protein